MQQLSHYEPYFATGVLVVVFGLGSRVLLNAVHFDIFAFSRRWTGFSCLRFLFFTFISAICPFVIGKSIGFGLLWRELRRRGGF